MSNLPRNVTRLRTAAFFHLKSAAALIEADSASDDDVGNAMSLIEKSLSRMQDFMEQRREHQKQDNPA